MATCMDDRCVNCGETRAQHLERRPQWQCRGGVGRFMPAPTCPRCETSDKVNTGGLGGWTKFRDGSSNHMCNRCGIGFKVDAAGRSIAV